MMNKRRNDNNRRRLSGGGARKQMRGPLMIKQLFGASILASVCVAAFATQAPARTPYDGSWSVLIVTTAGECDRAYRYGVSIIDGYVRYDGGMVNMSGRVSANGA